MAANTKLDQICAHLSTFFSLATQGDIQQARSEYDAALRIGGFPHADSSNELLSVIVAIDSFLAGNSDLRSAYDAYALFLFEQTKKGLFPRSPAA